MHMKVKMQPFLIGLEVRVHIYMTIGFDLVIIYLEAIAEIVVIAREF